MEKIIDKCLDLMSKINKESWLVGVCALGGILAIFLITLIISLVSGDFARCKSGAKHIIKGDVKKGVFKMHNQFPDFDRSLYICPKSNEIEYAKVVAHPYSYSLIKRLSTIVIIATAFFSILVLVLGVFAQEQNTSVTAFVTAETAMFVAFIIVLGFILFLISALIAALSLKKATKLYYAMMEEIKRINPPALQLTNDYGRASEVGASDEISVSEQADNEHQANIQQASTPQTEILPTTESAEKLVETIRAAALEGGLSVEQIGELFDSLEREKNDPQNCSEQSKLKLNEGATLLGIMLDSMEK